MSPKVPEDISAIELRERKARDQERINDQFATWLESPVVRMGISLVPGSDDHPDALKTLLRTAFEAGYGSGQVSFAVEMLTQMMAKRNNG